MILQSLPISSLWCNGKHFSIILISYNDYILKIVFIYENLHDENGSENVNIKIFHYAQGGKLLQLWPLTHHH